MLKTPNGDVIEEVTVFPVAGGEPVAVVPGAKLRMLACDPSASFTMVTFDAGEGQILTFTGHPLKISTRSARVLSPGDHPPIIHG